MGSAAKRSRILRFNGLKENGGSGSEKKVDR